MDPIPSSLRVARRLRGQSITYRRADSLRVPLRAIKGTTEVETADSYGAMTVIRFADWILERSDLVGTDGQPIEPAAGDEIDQETPGGTNTYQVTPTDTTAPPYRDVDEAGKWVRIHSQEITP